MVSLATLVAVDVVLRRVAPLAPRSGEFRPRGRPHALTSRTTLLQPRYEGRLVSDEFDVAIRINREGFRERDLDAVGTNSILFLGDSYFFGWGVDTVSRVSERMAATYAAEGRPVTVANLAIPGFGVRHSLEALDRFGSSLEPRLIVLGFFIGNDFLDDAGLTPAARPPAQGLTRRWRPRSLRQFLRTSPIVNRVRVGLWRFPAFRRMFNRTEVATDRLPLFDSESSLVQERLYAASFAALGELASACRTRGFPLLVVLIPDRLQVLDPEVFAHGDLRRPQVRLGARLDALGVAWLDLLPEFQCAKDRRRFYFAQDKHWTEAGHAFVADLIRRRLGESQIAPPAGQPASRPAKR